MSNLLPNDYQTFIATSRYARWLEEEGRRETWSETVSRYMDNIVRPKVGAEFNSSEIEQAILSLEVMPSMRAMMTAGAAAGGANGNGGGGMNQQMMGGNNRFTYEVRPDGTVDLPELGAVKLSGLNIDEAETYLESEFSKNYVNPLALIEVTNQRVLVFPGEAGVASVVPLVNPNTSLFEVLALRGGIRARGDARNVKLIRRSAAGQTIHQLDLSTIDGLKFANTTVQAGDIIYVEPLPQYAQEVLADIGPVLSLITTISSLANMAVSFCAKLNFPPRRAACLESRSEFPWIAVRPSPFGQSPEFCPPVEARLGSGGNLPEPRA